MVAATWSLATAPTVDPNMIPRRHLQLVAGIGQAFAVVPPALRPGQYDDIAAVPHSENSLDAAIHNWLDAAKEALSTRKGLSGMTLQTIAADLSVICGAAAATTNAAIALAWWSSCGTPRSLGTTTDRTGEPHEHFLQRPDHDLGASAARPVCRGARGTFRGATPKRLDRLTRPRRGPRGRRGSARQTPEFAGVTRGVRMLPNCLHEGDLVAV